MALDEVQSDLAHLAPWHMQKQIMTNQEPEGRKNEKGKKIKRRNKDALIPHRFEAEHTTAFWQEEKC